MASIRRVLVITMQAAKMTEQGQNAAAVAITFRNSMIELGVLGGLIVLFVASIWLLRRTRERELIAESGSPARNPEA